MGTGSDTDLEMLSDLLAILILRGAADTVAFSARERAVLRLAFPRGFTLDICGDGDGVVTVRVGRSEAKEGPHGATEG